MTSRRPDEALLRHCEYELLLLILATLEIVFYRLGVAIVNALLRSLLHELADDFFMCDELFLFVSSMRVLRY